MLELLYKFTVDCYIIQAGIEFQWYCSCVIDIHCVSNPWYSYDTHLYSCSIFYKQYLDCDIIRFGINFLNYYMARKKIVKEKKCS